MNVIRALVHFLTSNLARLHAKTAILPAAGLAAAAVLLLFGSGLTGCGANGYAGMSRAASGEIAFADAAGGVDSGSHGVAAVREVSAVQAGAGIEGRTTSGMSSGSTSPVPANSPKVPIIGEATMAAKAVSPLKTRKVLGVQSLACANQSMTGAGSTTCTLTLSSAAPSGGLVVTVSSNNAALSVPASVAVVAGSSRATFAATAVAVSTTQMANITANASGSVASVGIQLNAFNPALSISSTAVAFGGVVVGQTATSTVTLTSSGNAPLTISSISVAGSLFKATGVNAPLTLNPGQTAALTLQFYSDHTSSFTGIVTIASNAAQGAATINMSGDGVPALSGMACSAQSYTGAGTDSCVVSLYGPATSAGFAVSLASNNASVVVPASVTVAPGAMSASFSATVNSVSTGQTATLSATAGGVSKSFALQLGPASAVLTANASTIPFGSVLVNSPAEQPITLTASGSGPVTISSIAISGTGFSTSGLTAPLTLNPGQTAVVNVQFTPTAAVSYSGQVTIGSNASGGTIAIGLSGSGYKHSVQLGWSAPSSGAVAGYNVYRALSGSTAYQRVNTAALSATTFSDGNVQSGASYAYYVKSVDRSGVESNPSNTTTLSIPIP